MSSYAKPAAYLKAFNECLLTFSNNLSCVLVRIAAGRWIFTPNSLWGPYSSTCPLSVSKYTSTGQTWPLTKKRSEFLPYSRSDIYLFCFLCLSLYSSQRLEKVKQVLLGEIEDLEQDDTVLRSMEEELTVGVLTRQVPKNKNKNGLWCVNIYVNGLWFNQTISRLTGKSRPWPSTHTERKEPRGENITAFGWTYDERHRFPS